MICFPTSLLQVTIPMLNLHTSICSRCTISKKEHPEVYTSFQDGLHVVRRSDRYWAGLSTDSLAIEQVLIRSVKTRGGLTRGRGMSESQRLLCLHLWLHLLCLLENSIFHAPSKSQKITQKIRTIELVRGLGLFLG